MLQRRVGLAAYPAHDRRRRVARLDGDSHHLPTPRFNDIPPDTAQSFAIRLGAPSITQIEYDECHNCPLRFSCAETIRETSQNYYGEDNQCRHSMAPAWQVQR